MALLRTLRGLCTLSLGLPLTFIASTLTWLDLVIGRKSPAKALVFPPGGVAACAGLPA